MFVIPPSTIFRWKIIDSDWKKNAKKLNVPIFHQVWHLRIYPDVPSLSTIKVRNVSFPYRTPCRCYMYECKYVSNNSLKCMQNRKMQSFTYDMSMQSANILYLLGKPVKGNVEKYIIWKLEIKRPLASPARQYIL